MKIKVRILIFWGSAAYITLCVLNISSLPVVCIGHLRSFGPGNGDA